MVVVFFTEVVLWWTQKQFRLQFRSSSVTLRLKFRTGSLSRYRFQALTSFFQKLAIQQYLFAFVRF